LIQLLRENMLTIFKRHPLLAGGFALASLLVLFFAGHFVYNVIYWSAHQNETVKPWMTVGYVGRSWDLNPRLIDETAGLPLPVAGQPFTMQEVAAQRGVPVSEVIAKVEAAVAKLKAEGKTRKDGPEDAPK
jgi:hypothetical protein